MKSFATAGLIVAAATALCVSSAAAKVAPLTFPAGVALPPMSTRTANYYRTHPEAFSAFVTRLPRTDRPIVARPQPPTSPWVAMQHDPGALCDAHLMHNGNVLAQRCNDKAWFKLVPSSNGSYVAGTWSAIADMPVIGGVQYGPQYFASQVLPDGRLLVEGGEYNIATTTNQVLTNLGAIYSQSTNKWTAVNPPSGIMQIGDAQSVLLTTGRMLLGVCCNEYPPADFLFNASTLTWSSTGSPSEYNQDEEGYELLPSGKVLLVNVWNPPGTQLYNSGSWSAGQPTPVVLLDTCDTFEIGPAVVRGNQTLVAFGGDTCGTGPDPTAIRNNSNGMWSVGPTIPAVCGSGGTSYCSLADAPAAQLPDGRILFGANTGSGPSSYPTHFFEMTLNNVIVQTMDHPEGSVRAGFQFNFLMLPTGQVMVMDGLDAYVYNSTLPDETSWAPVISTAPTDITRGTAYTITGNQLNGRTAGAYYGDDWQSFTNFPLVKVVNNASGHVTYANSTDISTFSIAQNVAGSLKFTLPSKAQTGASKLYVVANGLRSAPQSITVH